MKFNLKRCIAMLLALATVLAFSSFPVFAAVTGSTLTGEDVEVENGTATVDVDVTFAVEGTGTLDGLIFKAVPDEGLVLDSVVLPAEYTKYEDLVNDSNISKNIIWIRNGEYATSYETAPTATYTLTFTVTDPTVAKTYNIDICEAVVEFDEGECDVISVEKDASVTVKAAEGGEDPLPPAPEVGGALIGKDVEVEAGTATVDVEVEFTTAGVSSLDGIIFKAVPDEGLVLDSVVLPAEYTKYEDLVNDSNISKNIIWIRNGEYATSYEAAPTATYVLTFTITDPTVAKTYNIDICEAVAEFDEGECDVIEVLKDAKVTVKALAPELSDDATLADLVIGDVTIDGFAADVFEYTVEIGNDVEEIEIGAVANGENAEIVVDAPEALVVGENVFTITVTAEDGTILVYTITVIKADGEVEPPAKSDDATLADLTIGGTTIEGFAADVFEYSVEVANEVEALEIEATANDDAAEVVITGADELVVGDNTVTVTVTAEDGTVLVYTITVTRAEPKSTDATLADLKVGETTVEGFAADVYEYSVAVANDVTELVVTATANDEAATYVVEGDGKLAVGKNEITVTVTAEDGTKLVYTIIVTRAELPEEDPELDYITIEDVDLANISDEVYDNDTYEVTATEEDGYIGIAIAVEELDEHENANGVDGYWIGFSVIAPENAVKAKYVFDTKANADWANAKILDELERNVNFDEEDGIAFYVDAEASSPKTIAMLQWLDADGKAITNVAKFVIDLSDVDTYAPSSGGSGGSGGGFFPRPDNKPPVTDPTVPVDPPVVDPGTPGTEVTFTDLAGFEWSVEAVEALVDAGVVNGMTATTYAPEQNVTRAEFTKLIVTAFGLTEIEGVTVEFTDVADTDWFAPYVKIGVANGIVKGYPDGSFLPEASITREEMCVMLSRALAAYNLTTAENTFADASDISDWAEPAVNLLSANGIINGMPGNVFVPQGTANRAESAVVIYRALKAIGK